jgi:hypothetical protein
MQVFIPDGSETYYVNDGDTSDDGPGGEYVTYPANEGRYSNASLHPGSQRQIDSL